jgi:hypothetical protein
MRRAVTTFPCGCVADSTGWHKECPAHEAEHRELHERAQRDHLRTLNPVNPNEDLL